MTRKKKTLSEAQMRERIVESVKQVLEAREKHLLMEMAYPRGVYKRKIDDEFPHILISSTGAWFITARLLASRYQKSIGREN